MFDDEKDAIEFLRNVMPDSPGPDTELCPELEKFFLGMMEAASEIIHVKVQRGIISKFPHPEAILLAVYELAEELLREALEDGSDAFVIDMLAAFSAQRIFEENASK